MEEIIESLHGVGYQGKCLDGTVLNEAIENGIKSESFRSIVAWISNELSSMANLEEKVNETCEVNEFLLELSGLLKEMSCPYPALISGPVSNRFHTHADRFLLLNYLLTELMASKMCHKIKPLERVVIEITESPSAAALKAIMLNLNLGKPPENISAKALFDKILPRVDEAIKKNGNQVPKALFSPAKPLTRDQWCKLEQIQKELDTEYDLRREMLITRLDVTVQSFQWSDNIKGKEDSIAQRYTNKRKELDYLKHGSKTTDLVELLAAREDIAIIDKTSSANVRENTQTDIQKHVIGRVPDRGGRAREHAPPPPEMPFWQQRSAGGGGGQRGGYGDGRGGRGGSFNQQPQQQRTFNQGNYQQQSNNYQQNQSQNYRGNSRVQGGWSQSGSGNGNRDYNNRNDGGGGNSGRNYQKNHQQYGQSHDGAAAAGAGAAGAGAAGAGAAGYGAAGGNAGGNQQGHRGGSGGNYHGNNSDRGEGERSRGQSNYNRGGGGGGGGGRRY